tara:strand:- start:110 stop:421 length:312 start_codon:yes stop_codon:yes gene_type:complete
MNFIKPSLTENTTKYYIRKSLIEVRNFKDKYITIIVNILLLLILFGGVSGFLLFKYKGKLSEEEKVIKERKKKQYLFQKLQQYSYEKQKKSQDLITNLPMTYP